MKRILLPTFVCVRSKWPHYWRLTVARPVSIRLCVCLSAVPLYRDLCTNICGRSFSQFYALSPVCHQFIFRLLFAFTAIRRSIENKTEFIYELIYNAESEWDWMGSGVSCADSPTSKTEESARGEQKVKWKVKYLNRMNTMKLYHPWVDAPNGRGREKMRAKNIKHNLDCSWID